MKYQLIISLILIYMTGFSQNTDIQKVTFTSMTRGFSEEVLITNDLITHTQGGNRKEQQNTTQRKIKDTEWESLLKNISGLNLTELESIESPTFKRSFDGAKHSSIIVTTKNGEFTHRFDDENPHQKLQDIMNSIIKIRENKE